MGTISSHFQAEVCDQDKEALEVPEDTTKTIPDPPAAAPAVETLPEKDTVAPTVCL